MGYTRKGLAAALAGLSMLVLAPAAQASGPGATIRYTEYGVPHIKARDLRGAGFGQGYAQARDHLCVIGEGMVSLAGQRSRWFGPDGPPSGTIVRASSNLASDLYFRGIADAGTVERLMGLPAPLGPSADVRDLVRGYTAGFNKHLAEGHRTSCAGAPWLRPMTEVDVYRRAYAWGMALGQSAAPDFLATGPSAGATAARADRMAGPGSNAIALGRDATVSGRGISIANPHLPWGGDYLWHQSHVTVPGKLDVIGASFVGMPTIAIGHTARMAWSGTITDGVTPFTLFELTLAGPTTYLVDGRPEPMTRRDVTVDTPAGPVTRTQWWTRYGPVVTNVRGNPLPWTTTTAYALADPNAGNLRLLNSLAAVNRAQSTGEYIEAVRRTQGISIFNMTVTDSRGDTAYSGMSVVPNVTDAHAERCGTALSRTLFPKQGLAVLDGSRADCAWATDRDAIQPGTFGPASLPLQWRTDYVSNSNQSYWLGNAAAPMTPTHRILGTAVSERNLRTRDTLTEITDQLRTGRFTPRSAMDLTLSNRVYAAELAIPGTLELCAAVGHKATDSAGRVVDLTAACTALAAWDKKSDVDSRGALLFTRYWSRVRSIPSGQLWRTPFALDSPVTTPNTLAADNPALAVALADAVSDLAGAGIAPDAPLGANQYVERGGKRFPIGGGRPELGVFNVITSAWDAQRGYADVGGAGSNSSSYLHVVALAGDGCPEAKTVMAYSQSSEPLSPHHTDQTELFSRKQWVTERFCDVDRHTVTVLRPRG